MNVPYEPNYHLRFRILFSVLALLVLGYVAFMNTTPGLYQKTLTMASDDLSSLVPTDRIVEHGDYSQQVSDLAYFYTDMNKSYDQATVTMTYKNDSPDQTLKLGYRDQAGWHYNTTIMDTPFINALTWGKLTDDGVSLYQKQPAYSSVGQFVSAAPADKVVGTYEYRPPASLFTHPVVPVASGLATEPALPSVPARIPVTLRGPTTLYTYANGDSFDISLTKHDLNWYPGADSLDVSVLSGDTVVAHTSLGDDGNAGRDHQPGNVQPLSLSVPSTPGQVYKISLDTTDDVLLADITASTGKLVAGGAVHVADNQTIYGTAVPKTAASNLYTNAPVIRLTSPHALAQTATAFTQAVTPAPNKPLVVRRPATTTTAIGQITIPKSDLIVDAAGFIAFSPDQFFEPTALKLFDITSAADLQYADVLLTTYVAPSVDQDGWRTAHITVALTDNHPTQGKLSWLIQAPGLESRGGVVNIKSYQVTLVKYGWLRPEERL